MLRERALSHRLFEGLSERGFPLAERESLVSSTLERANLSIGKFLLLIQRAQSPRLSKEQKQEGISSR